jgi:hypothetical protein
VIRREAESADAQKIGSVMGMMNGSVPFKVLVISYDDNRGIRNVLYVLQYSVAH